MILRLNPDTSLVRAAADDQFNPSNIIYIDLSGNEVNLQLVGV